MSLTYYFDTSALLKKYFFENGTETVKKILNSGHSIHTATLTYAEVQAAFQQTYRQGRFTKIQLSQAIHDFEIDWLKFDFVNLVRDVYKLIPKLLEKSPLRGADSVHMASFASLINEGIKTTFVASDKVLLNAIEDFGGKWINPEEA